MSKHKYQESFRLFSEYNGITVQEHDEMFESIYQETRQEKRKGLLQQFLHLFVEKKIIISTVMIIFFAGIGTIFHWNTAGESTVNVVSESTASDVFTARGEPAAGFVSLECNGTTSLEPCSKNDILVFHVMPPSGQKFFASFSRHLNTNSVVWYYPASQDERSLYIESSMKKTVLKEGIYIGDEHTAGEREVFSIFSSSPLSQDQIRALFDDNGEVKDRRVTVIKNIINIEG